MNEGPVEGERTACGWEDCDVPILVKRQSHVDGPDTLEWVHDVPNQQKVCPGWQPKAKPA